MTRQIKSATLITLLVLFLAGMALAQTDPGVQAASRGTGQPYASVASTPGLSAFFSDGQTRFNNVDTPASGLGPRFNSNSCGSCHAFPATGGSGPANNPQAQFTSNGVAPADTTPFFITAHGPTREVRFPFFFNADGSANLNAPNGGVEDIFTVTGSAGAGTCSLRQPSFDAAAAANNIIFRIPTPTFGAGLLANLDDSTLLKNAAANANNSLGISGALQHNGNDGTITRFGWKAQNKSLNIFSGEAYNVEQGVSNLLFTQDRPLPGEDQHGTGLPANCLNLAGNGYPEDTNNPSQSGAAILDDVSAFSEFMLLLAPPQPGSVVGASSTSVANGKALFSAIGCAVCHNPSLGHTQASSITAGLGNATVNAYTDLEIHHMGTGLADNVGQGGAGGDQFRSAPLWGLGQRIFLLHDGRTTNLLSAIQAHEGSGSEANQVEENFDALSASQKQDILNFLRSL